MIEDLIKKARERYPIYIHYTGFLTEEEIIELEKYCDIHCPSVFMDGSATYSIRYRKGQIYG